MARVGVDSEKMAKQFELMVPYSKPRERGGEMERDGRKEESSSVQVVGGGGSAWDQLSLSHTTHWPLHILFTPPVLHKSVNELERVIHLPGESGFVLILQVQCTLPGAVEVTSYAGISAPLLGIADAAPPQTRVSTPGVGAADAHGLPNRQPPVLRPG